MNHYPRLIKNKNGNIFLREWFQFQNVLGNGIYGCTALTNQSFLNEEYHNIIRAEMYNFLKINLGQLFFNFEVNQGLIFSDKYIELAENREIQMVDFEISVINKNYMLIFIYLKRENNIYIYYLIWVIFMINSKIFVSICFVVCSYYNACS